MATAYQLGVPATDSAWRAAAAHVATDAARLILLATYGKVGYPVLVGELTRNPDGRWGHWQLLGDASTDAGLKARLDQGLVEPDCALAASGLATILGRDTDTAFARWWGRRLLVQARQEGRLVDLDSAYLAAFGDRQRYQRGNHEMGPSESTLVGHVAAWQVTAAILAEQVLAYRARRHRPPNPEQVASHADDQAATVALGHYAGRIELQAQDVLNSAIRLKRAYQLEVGQALSQLLGIVEPPAPSSEALNGVRNRILQLTVPFSVDTRER